MTNQQTNAFYSIGYLITATVILYLTFSSGGGDDENYSGSQSYNRTPDVTMEQIQEEHIRLLTENFQDVVRERDKLLEENRLLKEKLRLVRGNNIHVPEGIER